jgi:hypothetical protein
MLVTIIMFTLVAGSITAVVITSLKHQTSLADRGSALAAARNALEQVDRDIRSANPLCLATSSEVAVLETPQTSPVTPAYIVDYQIAGNKLWFYQYATSQVPPPGVPSPLVCNEPVTVGTTTGTTPVYEQNSYTAKRVVLNNVVSNTLFTIPPSTTVISNCPTGGTAPTTTPVASIAELTATLSVQPPTLSKPVTASDCGTYLRNSAVPTT